MGFLTKVRTILHHPAFASPAIALGLTAFSLLLLVLVLQSVPGPIHGMYWFSIPGESTGNGRLLGGVMGWCMKDFANCTYAPLSENPYLSGNIDAGQALTVRIMLPLACYWMIVTLGFWVLLAVTVNTGYTIKNLDSISRHLYFAVVEACVLCVSTFGNVLCWLAFGLGREAFLTIRRTDGVDATSGQAMEVAAVAALISLFSLFAAVWGLRLRLRSAQKQWKQEVVMVRRRSMAMSAAGIPTDGRGNRLSVSGDIVPLSQEEKKRWSSVSVTTSAYMAGLGLEKGPDVQGQPQGQPQGQGQGQWARAEGEEERLDERLAVARRNSLDHATVQRASVIGTHDDPYAAATGQHTHQYSNA